MFLRQLRLLHQSTASKISPSILLMDAPAPAPFDIKYAMLLQDVKKEALDTCFPGLYTEATGTKAVDGLKVAFESRLIGKIAVKLSMGRGPRLWIPMIIDTGSPINVLHYATLEKLGYPFPKEYLHNLKNPKDKIVDNSLVPPQTKIDIGRIESTATDINASHAEGDYLYGINVLGMQVLQRIYGNDLHKIEKDMDTRIHSDPTPPPPDRLALLPDETTIEEVIKTIATMTKNTVDLFASDLKILQSITRSAGGVRFMTVHDIDQLPVNPVVRACLHRVHTGGRV